MSTKKSMAASQVHRLKPQVFVSALVPNAKTPPKVRVIRGYVGESTEQNHTRVYLDVELRRFVDIPADSIVHSEAIPPTVIPLGGVYVWVREDARILHRGSWFASEDPTTMATGEEGGGDPTTMATGEEAMGFESPLDIVINPFGKF